MLATTNPQCRCALTIWSAGEEADASRFFHLVAVMEEFGRDLPLTMLGLKECALAGAHSFNPSLRRIPAYALRTFNRKISA